MNVKTLHGASYFLTFIDDYSRYNYVSLLSHCSEALHCFRRLVAEVRLKQKRKRKIKALWTDNAYLSDQFKGLM